MMARALLIAFMVLAAAAWQVPARQARSDRFLLACSVFTPSTTEADLRTRFGAENVTTGSVPDPNGSEGDRTEGTILFERDPEVRLEISWKDPAGKRRPAYVSRMDDRGPWRTSAGITFGTDLKTVERLNGRPFRLAGMGFDAQGGVVSWSGGRLESQSTTDCHVGIALRTGATAGDPMAEALERQISGDKIFSSGHPAMQARNPTVYLLVLRFGERIPGSR